jgi:hypothetical protein
MLDAACADRPDLDWFNLDCGLIECIKICRTCTVQNDCLNWAAFNNLTEGVWGGKWGQDLVDAVRKRRGGRC